MNPNEYQQLALSTEADQEKILNRLYRMGTQGIRLDNGGRGLADDAGEVNGVIKRYIEYGEPLDTAGLLEECGDCLWRICQVLAAAGLTLEQCMDANLAKLKVRYQGEYADKKAWEANRNRSAERKELCNQAGAGYERSTQLEQTGQGWAEPIEISSEPPSFVVYQYRTNPFDVARQVADCFVQGSDRERAMKYISEQEAKANG